MDRDEEAREHHKAYCKRSDVKARKNDARRRKYSEDKEYREQMKAAANATYHRDPWAAERIFARNYGFTLEEAKDILASMPDRCELCGSKPGGNKRLSYDHCHSTGRFRAWLCHKCNRGLGLFNDDPLLLRAAADYVDAHSLVH